MMSPNKARKRLACIRCVLDSVKRIKNNEPLSHELCFIPKEVEFVITPDVINSVRITPLHFSVWSSPSKKDGKLIGRITVAESKFKTFCLTVTGEEYADDSGDWVKLTKESIKLTDIITENKSEESDAWLLWHARDTRSENVPVLVPKYELSESLKQPTSKDDIFDGWVSGLQKKQGDEKKSKNVYKWQNVVESNYMLHIVPSQLPSNAFIEAIERLSTPPPNWSLEADEELVRFLADHCKSHGQSMGGASKYIESVTVSTEQEFASNLLDGDPDTFWESDGSLGRHYIRLQIMAGVIIQKLIIGVDQEDDNYMPRRVLVYGCTDGGQSKMLNETRIDCNTPNGDVVIMENAPEYFPTIEIRIKECKDDGIDCRIHYVKIVSSKQKQSGLNRNLFDKDLIRYPKLESIDLKDRDMLYRRAQALNRFISLFDSVIQYLLPSWEYTAGTYSCLEAVRQLLPLSRRRHGLIENCLGESQGATPSTMARIFVNRHLAAEHLVDPSLDPEAKNSIFNQLYEALRPEKCEVKLDYRWPLKYDQWWECKFIGEGIIDQGGGFRDSLSDLAEELCPSSQTHIPLPLPYFVRSPNQTATSNVYRDCYVPNSDCHQLSRYEWIGQLMGACLRGKEYLVISLPPFLWKMLNGESITFEKDYYTVDAAEVQFHETLSKTSEEKFVEAFGNVLTYTTTLVNGKEVILKENGENEFVKFEEIGSFMQLAKEKRMNEFKEQVNAIRSGLEKVVPKAVLSLMTWQELETRICGEPEITVEALKKSAHCEEFEEENDSTITYLWQAIENFTNEDRSRFLRFVTGRRRLPTPLYIARSKSSTPVNSLPESATCSHTLFLPTYTSASNAEEKLRYAAYNCIAIDADMSPWEE